jgi:hypothetical protein
MKMNIIEEILFVITSVLVIVYILAFLLRKWWVFTKHYEISNEFVNIMIPALTITIMFILSLYYTEDF